MGEKIAGIKASYPYIQTCLNRIVVWESFCPPQPHYEPPNLEEISIMLQAGNRQGIRRIINRYLERLKLGGSASEEMLISFQYDMMQLIFSWLSKEQIEAHRLFANSDADEMMKAAPHSIAAMQKYLFYLVDRAMDYSNLVKDNQSVAQRLLFSFKRVRQVSRIQPARSRLVGDRLYLYLRFPGCLQNTAVPQSLGQFFWISYHSFLPPLSDSPFVLFIIQKIFPDPRKKADFS